MKILNIISSLLTGGAEQQLCYLAGEMAEMGHDVHVAYIKAGSNSVKLKGQRITLHLLRALNNYDPFLIVQLLNIIRKIQPDIIQTWTLQMDILGGISACVTRTPWVLREPSSAMAYPSRLKTKLRLALGSKAAFIVSNSFGGFQYWRSNCPKAVCVIIPNGFPFNKIKAVSSASLDKTGSSSNMRFILYIGRFMKEKNLDNLTAAFACALSKLPVFAVICGDGPKRESLVEKIGRLGLNKRVLLTGIIPNELVWSLMQRAEAFVFVSEFEGFPNVLIEAMICGCPLVVSDIPAHRELLNDDTALFVNPYNPEEISSAIIQTVCDTVKTQDRIKRALERARQFPVGSMAKEYERLYAQVFAKHND